MKALTSILKFFKSRLKVDKNSPEYKKRYREIKLFLETGQTYISEDDKLNFWLSEKYSHHGNRKYWPEETERNFRLQLKVLKEYLEEHRNI